MTNKNGKTRIRNFYLIAIGLVLILLGGILHILTGFLFWYPLGLVTIPLIQAWINFVQSKEKPTAKPTPTEPTPSA